MLLDYLDYINLYLLIFKLMTPIIYLTRFKGSLIIENIVIFAINIF